MYDDILIPALCSLFIICLSRQTVCIELKKPFQIHTQVRAKEPFRVPSMLTNKSLPIAKDTRAAINPAIGIIFHSSMYINILKNLNRYIGICLKYPLLLSLISKSSKFFY